MLQLNNDFLETLICPDLSFGDSLTFTVSTGNIELDNKIIKGLSEIKEYCVMSANIAYS